MHTSARFCVVKADAERALWPRCRPRPRSTARATIARVARTTRWPTDGHRTARSSTSSCGAPSSSTSSSPGWRAARARHRGLGRRDGLVPRRHREPGRSPSSRLGLRTSLAAAFGDDDYADFCWRTLAEQEHVDLQPLAPVRRTGTRRSPSRCRSTATATHGHPRARRAGDGDRDDRPAAALPRGPRRPRPAEPLGRGDRARPGPTWPSADGALRLRRRRLGPHRRLVPARSSTSSSACHAFMPNAAEAMAYTRTDTAARRALRPGRPGPARGRHQRRATAPSPSTPPPARRSRVPALRVAGARPDRRRRRLRRQHRRRHARRLAAGRPARFADALLGAGGPAVRRLARRPRLGRHRRLVARGARHHGQRGSYHSSLLRRYALPRRDRARPAARRRAPGGGDDRPARRRRGHPVTRPRPRPPRTVPSWSSFLSPGARDEPP